MSYVPFRLDFSRAFDRFEFSPSGERAVSTSASHHTSQAVLHHIPSGLSQEISEITSVYSCDIVWNDTGDHFAFYDSAGCQVFRCIAGGPTYKLLCSHGIGLTSMKFHGNNDVLAVRRDLRVSLFSADGEFKHTSRQTLEPLPATSRRYRVTHGDGYVALWNDEQVSIWRVGLKLALSQLFKGACGERITHVQWFQRVGFVVVGAFGHLSVYDPGAERWVYEVSIANDHLRTLGAEYRRSRNSGSVSIPLATVVNATQSPTGHSFRVSYGIRGPDDFTIVAAVHPDESPDVSVVGGRALLELPELLVVQHPDGIAVQRDRAQSLPYRPRGDSYQVACSANGNCIYARTFGCTGTERAWKWRP